MLHFSRDINDYERIWGFLIEFGFIYVDMAALILYYIKHVLNPLIIFTCSTDFKSLFKKLSAEMRGKSRQITTTVQIGENESLAMKPRVNLQILA